MIIKSFQIKKDILQKNNIILFYGKNEGYKIQEINKLINKNRTYFVDEKEVLENKENFFNSLLSGSLFEKEKTYVIKRATDKIIEIIEELELRAIKDFIILNSDQLDKRSKLRTFFEKNKKFICVPFYEDNDQTLIKISYEFFNKKKIPISQADINTIVQNSNKSREILLNELTKIEFFTKKGKKINSENLGKLINSPENFSISELIDNYLIHNRKKIINILNENNFVNEDCIVIVRTFISKLKRILKLSNEFKITKNIDLTISSAKPPIFWKDKEITKQQIYKWPPENIKLLMYKLSEIELLIKKNYNNSIKLITDFILDEKMINSNNYL